MNGYLPHVRIHWAIVVPYICSAGLFIVAALARVSKFAKLKRMTKDLAGLAGLVFFCAVAFTLLAIGPVIADFYVPVVFASGWAALAAGVVGVVLFFLRRVALWVYATIEVSGAIVTLLICGISTYGSPYQRGSALVGAIYFLIRGLDNAEKANLAHIVIHRLRAFEYRKIAAAVVVSVAAIFVAMLPKPTDFVAPPYLTSKDGLRMPVSPMDCGDLFIVCDEAAWRERDRLVKGTAADRAKAEQEAERRAAPVIDLIDRRTGRSK